MYSYTLQTCFPYDEGWDKHVLPIVRGVIFRLNVLGSLFLCIYMDYNRSSVPLACRVRPQYRGVLWMRLQKPRPRVTTLLTKRPYAQDKGWDFAALLRWKWRLHNLAIFSTGKLNDIQPTDQPTKLLSTSNGTIVYTKGTTLSLEINLRNTFSDYHRI